MHVDLTEANKEKVLQIQGQTGISIAEIVNRVLASVTDFEVHQIIAFKNIQEPTATIRLKKVRKVSRMRFPL